MANNERGSYQPPEKKRFHEKQRPNRTYASEHDDLPYTSSEIIYEKKVPTQSKVAHALVGEIKLLPDTNMLFREGRGAKKLSEVQAAIMEKLIDEAGKAVSPEELAQIYGADVQDPGRAIRLVMNRLRKKLDDDPDSPQIIKSFKGRGYALAVPPDAPIPEEVKLQGHIAGAEITLNTSTGEVRRDDGDPQELTVNEHLILQFLMEHPGKTYDPLTLYSACYPEEEIRPDDPALMGIKVLIGRIRNKIGDTEPENPLIVTYEKPRYQQGENVGYAFGFPQEEESSHELEE